MTPQEQMDEIARRLADAAEQVTRDMINVCSTPAQQEKCANGTCACAYHVDFSFVVR